MSSTTISPGTNSFAGITFILPFLITLLTCALNFCKASNDFSALFSCITPITAFKTTTIRIIMESVIPSPSIYPTTPEIIAAIINTIIIKSLNCSKNFTNVLFFFLACNSFVPYFALFSLTFLLVRPFSSTLKYSLVSSTDL